MLDYLQVKLGNFLVRDEDGQTAVEYALVLLLVAIVLAGVLATGLTGALNDTIDAIKAKL